MSIRKIVYIPDERLRKQSSIVDTFDDNLQILINDMFDTMYAANGVGLAAPQIGINLQLSVIDVVGDKQNQIVIINPEIVEREEEMEFQEGCLSIPGCYDTVIRAHKVKVKALNRFGQSFEIAGEGLLAECLQHEIDHLNGKLFIDLLSPLRRSIVRKKCEKFLKSKDRKK